MGKFKKLFPLAVLSGMLLGVLCSCRGAALMSSREVETHLEKLYGEEFSVTGYDDVPTDNLGYNVHKARVFRIKPKNDPELGFYAFSIISWETGGIFGYSEGFRDNYTLEKLGPQLIEALEEMAACYEVTYRSYPFEHSENYYSDMSISVRISQDNLYSHCQILSDTWKSVLEEMPSISGFSAGVSVILKYRDDDWAESQECGIHFTPYYGSDLKGTKAATWDWTLSGLEPDDIYNSCQQKIRQYAGLYGSAE